MPFTENQLRAATEHGRPLLVSAAAGSGKTTVLVERLMRYVDPKKDENAEVNREDGANAPATANINDFLVITYTRAAAAELRSRILSELNTRLSADPRNQHLRRQTERCIRADIGTIDSICGRILREYVHLTDLTPDFRVVEEERSAAMKRAALNRVLEERYEQIDEDADFRALADSVGAGRDDSKLVELVLSLYDSLRSHPHPQSWMDECAAALALEDTVDAGQTVWGQYLLQRGAEKAEYWAARLEQCMALMNEPGHEALWKAYGAGFTDAAEAVRNAGRAARLGWDATAACFPIAMKAGRYAKKEDLELKEYVKNVFDQCKKAMETLGQEFAMDSDTLLADLRCTAPAMRALLSLTSALDAAYAADKRRGALVDFSDQEHLVLELLETHSEVAEELSERWTEVLVDEYQDVNDCQDTLFTLLSNGGKKLFLVGDVKQSIYRFRLANPAIFLRKYEEFTPIENTDDSDKDGARILLRENFRSSDAVLSATNYVFSAILSKTLGEMDYDEAAMLVHGRTENEGYAAPVAELTIYDIPAAADGEDRPDKSALEAAAVAKRIRALVEGGTLIPDGHGGLRALQYPDVAILLRSFKGAAPRYRAALSVEGVPCASSQGGSFFRSLEVTMLLSLLSVLDNPRQDIPLIAVLRSPLFGFTPDELAAIRVKDKSADFYTALTLAGQDDERCADFLRTLDSLRSLAPELTVYDLLSELCTRLDVSALLAAMPESEVRRQNLRCLLDYAVQFEQSGYKGLFRFVQWMKRLSDRGDEPFTPGGGSGVQLMSIHRSKGLEYPVVFLCDTAHQFNLSDARDSVLVHPSLGIGAKLTDAERGVEYPTLSWRAIGACLKRESLSEEMRVLYVAMTRARERLYITAAWKDAEKTLARLNADPALPVAPLLLEGDKSMSHWLARCARPDSPYLTLRVERLESGERDGAAAADEPPVQEPAAPLHIREKLDWRYPWEASETLPSKLTASDWKAGELPDGEASVPAVTDRPRRQVNLSDRERPLTGAERGTAVHLSLQFIDYAKCADREGIVSELERLLALGHLTEAQAKAVRPEILLNFFRSEVGQRILRADRVYREQRFTLLLPADTVGGSAEDEILFQGVVDCVIEEDGQLTVIDYKTDYVTEETLAEKAESYRGQVRSYADAMTRIRRMPVKEGILYFLSLGRAVNIEL